MSNVVNIEQYRSYDHKKEPIIYLNLNKILDFAVDYSLLLSEEADIENIKKALKIIFEKVKDDYDEVVINF